MALIALTFVTLLVSQALAFPLIGGGYGGGIIGGCIDVYDVGCGFGIGGYDVGFGGGFGFGDGFGYGDDFGYGGYGLGFGDGFGIGGGIGFGGYGGGGIGFGGYGGGGLGFGGYGGGGLGFGGGYGGYGVGVNYPGAVGYGRENFVRRNPFYGGLEYGVRDEIVYRPPISRFYGIYFPYTVCATYGCGY